jgi:hypothetical protein
MQPSATIEPTGSPVPEAIAEPVRAHDDTAAAHQRLAATPTASGTTKPASSPGPRNPASIVLAKLLSVIRGDKYMADAYEPAWSARLAERASAAVAAQPTTTERAAPAAAQAKER